MRPSRHFNGSVANKVALISAAELQAQPQRHIFDCRFNLSQPAAGAQAYAEAHIPGARYVHLDHDLSRPRSGRNGRHPLPDRAVFAMRLGHLGLTPDTPVAIYDDAGGMFAARLWWMLRWVGHRAAVDILDGGLQAWRAAGFALTDRVPAHHEADYPLQQGDAVVMADDVMSLLNTSAIYLLDARSSDRFRGENETLDPVGGHIPGAHNRFFRDNLTDEGYFKSPHELRREFLALLGNHDPSTVVHTCGSGVTACHNLFAMEIAGFTGARLYAGSWSEWCSDPSRPIEIGPAREP